MNSDTEYDRRRGDGTYFRAVVLDRNTLSQCT